MEGQVRWCTSIILNLLQVRGIKGRPVAVIHICNPDTPAGEMETGKARCSGVDL